MFISNTVMGFCFSAIFLCFFPTFCLTLKENGDRKLPFDCGIFPETNFRGDPLTLQGSTKLGLNVNNAIQFDTDSFSVLLKEGCMALVCTHANSEEYCIELSKTEVDIPTVTLNSSTPVSASCHCSSKIKPSVPPPSKSCATIYKEWFYAGKSQHARHSGSTSRIHYDFRSVFVKPGCSISFWSSLSSNIQFSFVLENSTSYIKNNLDDSNLWYCCSCDPCSNSVCQRARDEISGNEEDDQEYDFSQFVHYNRKIIGVGRNYRWHKVELSKVVAESETPIIFLKPTSSFIEEGTAIKLPSNLGTIFYELELGVVIGKRGKDINEKEALNYVAGYFLALDMTAKDFLKKAISEGRPWELGKGFDYACPVSSFVPKRLVPDPNNLQLSCKVNGNLTQYANTNSMIHNVEKLISYTSKYMTLEPFDVILTGTPDGFGALYSGDVVEGELDNLMKIHFNAL